MSAHETWRRLSLSFILIGACTALAMAETPKTAFLTPNRSTVRVGDTLALRLDAGAAKDARPAAWPAGEVSWMFIRGGPEQENRHDVRPARAGDSTVNVTIAHPGVTAIGIEQRPPVSQWTGAELQAFCTEHADAAVVNAAKNVAADQKVRVRHIATATALIRTADDSEPSDIVTSRAGLPVEIRLLADPTAAVVGSDVPVWVYVGGGKLAGVRVQATNVTTGQSETLVTGPGGVGHFRIAAGGTWRVEAHHAAALQNDKAADWATYSATLAFEVKGGRP